MLCYVHGILLYWMRPLFIFEGLVVIINLYAICHSLVSLVWSKSNTTTNFTTLLQLCHMAIDSWVMKSWTHMNLQLYFHHLQLTTQVSCNKSCKNRCGSRLTPLVCKMFHIHYDSITSINCLRCLCHAFSDLLACVPACLLIIVLGFL